MNCKIVITQTMDTKTTVTTYELDDYRIATAICNILDNVCEVHMEGEVDSFEFLPIKKTISHQ